MSTLEEKAQHVADALNKDHVKQAVRITATASKTPLPKTASKFGGIPYVPMGASAPTNSSGQPLGMIAQINCAELPPNDIYPKTGMVQFWIDPKDEAWGFDAAKPASQENWRVIYYKNVGRPDPNTTLPAVEPKDNWPVEPTQAEFALSFEVIEQGITGAANYYYEDFARVWNKMYPESQLESYQEAQGAALTIEENDEFSKIGGYPYFVQSDPRFFNEALQGHTVNLLTIVSEVDWAEPHDGSPKLMWCGGGAANWLIPPDQLAAGDFSNVIFEWSSS